MKIGNIQFDQFFVKILLKFRAIIGQYEYYRILEYFDADIKRNENMENLEKQQKGNILAEIKVSDFSKEKETQKDVEKCGKNVWF
ncbi:MAG: hypothetical protein HYW77_00460 [Parcubacteria group bacterium]|nr:hypothetical protein [Parcubacteria group bacterium]